MVSLLKKKKILAAKFAGGGVSVPFGGLVSVVNLVSYWKLDEASGTRVDSVGTNHLTPTNAPVGVAGKIGNAAQFVTANSKNLIRASNPSLQAGDSDFTITCWFNYASVPAHFVAKDNVGSGREYQLFVNQSSLFPSFETNGGFLVQSPVGVSSNAWHFMICWRDKAAGTISIQVDGGTVQTAAAAVPAVGNANFTIGSLDGVLYLNGMIDEVGIWKRVLTPTERTALYNSGNGLTY